MPDKRLYLIPPEGHRDVGKAVLEVLNTVIEDKKNLGLHDRWLKNYKLRRNKHWSTESTASLPLVSANLIFTHVERTKNELTDNNPCFDIANIGGADDREKQISTDLQHTTEHWWIDQEQQDILESSVLNGELYGVAIEKVWFNPELEYGLGEVETCIVDPFHFGWYPVKLKDPKDINNPGKCEAVLHFYPQNIRFLRTEYPDLADKIKPDGDVLAELGDERREINSSSSGKKGETVSLSGVVQNILNFVTGDVGGSLEDETVVCEMWLRDGEMVPDGEPEEDEDGRTIQRSRAKYTGGIRYILVCSGGVVLEDKDNPNINPSLPPDEAMKTYLYDKFPFVAVNSLKDTSNAWGMSDIEQIEVIQKELNKSLSQMIVEKDRMVRPKLINPKDTGVSNDELNNIVGVINPNSSMASQALRWLVPPPPTGDVQSSIEVLKSLLLLIAGTFDLDTAQTGNRVIAYKAISALLERAATQKRGKIRNYGRLIRERGRMFLSHVMNFYTEERWITYRDESGEKAAKPIIGSHMIVPVKLTVVTGSTLPVSGVQKREEALQLYQLGAIDKKALLDELNWSGTNEIIKRMQAGPLGVAFEGMMKAGVPPEILQYLQMVSQEDSKRIDDAIQSGELPPFDVVLQQLMANSQPQQPQPDPEMVRALAEVKKLEAEAALITAKIQTEAVNQKVALDGVAFDKENLTIQRAKAVAEMEAGLRSRRREDMEAGAEIVSNLNNAPGYNEKGMESNNQEVLE